MLRVTVLLAAIPTAATFPPRRMRSRIQANVCPPTLSTAADQRAEAKPTGAAPD